MSIIATIGIIFIVSTAWACCLVSGECSRAEEQYLMEEFYEQI